MERTLQLLKDILDHAPQPIAVFTGKELRIELANKAMVKTWGKGSDVVGRAYLEVVPEVRRQGIFEEALWAYESGNPFHARDKRVDLMIDGQQKTFYFNYSFIPLFDNRGKVYGIMNTGMDVTGLHAARETAQSASDQLQMAVDASGLGTYEIDLINGNIAASANFKSIWAVQDPITSGSITAKIHPEDLPLREQAHREAEHTGLLSYQARIKTGAESFRWVTVKGKIISDEKGSGVKIIGIIEDIGWQKALEERLQKEAQQTSDELRSSNEELLHFANLVSHDLKEPVRKIKTFISRLKSEHTHEVSEKQSFYLDRIEHTALRMQTVIEDILAYSGTGKKEQHVQSIDLNQVLEDIKLDLELVIHEKKAVLMSLDLPTIEGSAVLIGQLLYNLVHNGLKFTRAGVAPKIVIASYIISSGGEKAVRIDVQDNGIGIEQAFSERIFTAFERLHSKDQYEGSGLGLSLCRKIAARHGGSITASAANGGGSVFTVVLPIKQKKHTI